jgi:hypothetical protein
MTYGWRAERTSLCIALFAFVLVPSLSAQTMDQGLTNRIKSQETSCISTLRTINVAEGTYWGGVDSRGYAGSLKKLGPSGESLIDAVTASGKKDGYRFRLRPEHRVEHSPVRHYTITARPIIRLSNDQRSFFTDETGVIRFTAKNRDATIKDPAME